MQQPHSRCRREDAQSPLLSYVLGASEQLSICASRLNSTLETDFAETDFEERKRRIKMQNTHIFTHITQHSASPWTHCLKYI